MSSSSARLLASSHLAVLDSSRHSNSSSFQTVWSQRKKSTEPVLWGGDSATSASPLRVLATSSLEIAESRLPSTFAAAGGFVADPQPNDGSKQGAAPAPLDTPVVLALKRLWYCVGKDEAVSFPPAAAATERICSRDVPHPDDIDGPAIENGMELWAKGKKYGIERGRKLREDVGPEGRAEVKEAPSCGGSGGDSCRGCAPERFTSTPLGRRCCDSRVALLSSTLDEGWVEGQGRDTGSTAADARCRQESNRSRELASSLAGSERPIRP